MLICLAVGVCIIGGKNSPWSHVTRAHRKALILVGGEKKFGKIHSKIYLGVFPGKGGVSSRNLGKILFKIRITRVNLENERLNSPRLFGENWKKLLMMTRVAGGGGVTKKIVFQPKFTKIFCQKFKIELVAPSKMIKTSSTKFSTSFQC